MGPSVQGKQFEDRVQECAVLRGYAVRPAGSHKCQYDLTISGKRVQCKSKTMQKNRSYLLHCTRRIARDEFDVLALTCRPSTDDPFGPIFLIPSSALLSPVSDGLVRTVTHKWLCDNHMYMENWEVFD